MSARPFRSAPEITKRRRTRLQRSELRKGIRPHVLDATFLYEQEVAMVLRALARYLHGPGFAPTAHVLAIRRRWDEDALKAYLEDMEASGLAKMMPGRGWMPTEAGFAAIHVLPAIPRYSTNSAARREQRQREKDAEGSIECHALAVASV